MKKSKWIGALTVTIGFFFLSAALVAQAPVDWPMVNGDNTGQHYSSLTKINSSNVAGLKAPPPSFRKMHHRTATSAVPPS